MKRSNYCKPRWGCVISLRTDLVPCSRIWSQHGSNLKCITNYKKNRLTDFSYTMPPRDGTSMVRMRNFYWVCHSPGSHVKNHYSKDCTQVPENVFFTYNPPVCLPCAELNQCSVKNNFHLINETQTWIQWRLMTIVLSQSATPTTLLTHGLISGSYIRGNNMTFVLPNWYANENLSL